MKEKYLYAVMREYAMARKGEYNSAIFAITDSIEKAKEIFRTNVDEEKELAEDNNWQIYEDSDMEFDAGEDGFYIANHTRLVIQQVIFCEE